MGLPRLYSLQNGRSILTAFGGLNESYACGEAEFTEEMNFSSQSYPALQTRNPRRKLGTLANCNGMYHLNGRLTCTGTTLTYRLDDDSTGTPYFELKNAVTNTKKIMVGMGTQILIWPDAKSFDTKTGKLESLSAEWSQGSGTVKISPCDAGGKTYEVEDYGKTEPDLETDPQPDGTMFLRVNDIRKPWSYMSTLLQCDATMKKWVEIKLSNVRLTLPGLAAAGFKKGDTMTVSGIPSEVETYLAGNLNGEVSIEQMDGDSIVVTGAPVQESKAYFGGWEINTKTAKWISIDGGQVAIYNADKTGITAQRRVPELEYLTENSNRVWGCNSKENVIYSCKQGDPTNWYCYNGIASDSYAVTVGSEGGHLHGICAVFQRKYDPQNLWQPPGGLSGGEHPVPGCGQGSKPEPERHQRNAVLPEHRGRDGLGRKPAGEHFGQAGPFLADEREVCSRRGLGCPVLPLCQGQQRGDSAAGV